jgi:hypothetical protein
MQLRDNEFIVCQQAGLTVLGFCGIVPFPGRVRLFFRAFFSPACGKIEYCSFSMVSATAKSRNDEERIDQFVRHTEICQHDNNYLFENHSLPVRIKELQLLQVERKKSGEC